MPRLDMLTSDWHQLLTPALPHALNDKDEPALSVIRLESAGDVVYAIGFDRYTLGCERLQLRDPLWEPPPPVHIRTADAAASLRLFPHSKDENPPLRITVDTAAIPIAAAGRPADVPRYAITLESPDGTRLVLHDQRDPSSDPLGNWRQILAGVFTRPLARTAPALSLNATYLAKWAKAARKGERLLMFTGAKEGTPILVLVEDHFAGVWVQVNYLEGPAKKLAESPWLGDLGIDELAVALSGFEDQGVEVTFTPAGGGDE